ncbi:MAG TPA: Gfo/Idh/MocA family oxidoreductase, partial [Actinotalea sp.]|nr:Gfo/Idh/MocA family oxidoreductase [Actinotalea sp.]
MSTRLGVGLISAGWMGTVHARGYLGLPDKFPELGVSPALVQVADPVTANAQRLVDRLGFGSLTTDYRDVLADPAVHVVSPCAPNYLHPRFALEAAAPGKPFWIEKPMGAGVADSRAIGAAVAAAGLVTAVGFNYRHAPGVAKLRALVRAGRLGRVTNVRVRFDADYSSAPDGPRTWR